MENQTIAYYNQNAASFIQGTVSVDFQMTQDKFLNALPGKSWISGVVPEETRSIFWETVLLLRRWTVQKNCANTPVPIPVFR